MSDLKQPADLRDGIQMWVELAVHKYRAASDPVIMGECSAESVAEILSLCEAAALAALPEKKTLDSPNWIDDGILLGDKEERIAHNSVIATAQANIHKSFGGGA